jgi:hypothetical protein
MRSLIPILCPECGLATLTPRQPYDYPEAVRLELLCEECGKGGFPESCYYDRDDKHITRDPDCDVHEWRSGK